MSSNQSGRSGQHQEGQAEEQSVAAAGGFRVGSGKRRLAHRHHL